MRMYPFAIVLHHPPERMVVDAEVAGPQLENHVPLGAKDERRTAGTRGFR
jgi:hypothetical protein